MSDFDWPQSEAKYDVAVMRNVKNHPQLRFNPEIETCTKDDENQNCFGEGVGNTYSRDANRDWVLAEFGAAP